jgi:phage shock protein PspC (stress-responsive transcriptional regulator)
MPSLLRFLFVLAVLGGMGFGTLYVLATYFEPETKEISKPVRNLKLQRN